MRPIKTRFPYGSPKRLTLLLRSKSLTHYTKGTQSQNKSAPTACTYTVSGSISLPSPGFFSPFPHGTGSLSVTWEYLALPDGPGRFAQDFSCPVLLGCQSQQGISFSITGLSPSTAGLSMPLHLMIFFLTCRTRHDRFQIGPTTPLMQNS